MTYEMTTISSGTRIREDHNVYAPVLTSVGAGVIVKGTELWTAPLDENNVKAGDRWLHITYGGIIGWMALTHMGISICKDFKVINETEPTPIPTPTTVTYTATIEDNETGEVWSGILSKQ